MILNDKAQARALAASLLAVLTLCSVLLVLIGYALIGFTSSRSPHIVSRSGAAAPFGATAAQLKPAHDEPSSYEPTSEYIEPGADSDESAMEFGAAEDSAAQDDTAPLDEIDVEEVIEAYHHELIACYAEGLERQEMSGRVDFHFRLAPDGHVAMVKITQSELEDPSVEACFVESARRWQFPPTRRSTLMRFDTDFTFAY